jgi:hypothetical protein
MVRNRAPLDLSANRVSDVVPVFDGHPNDPEQVPGETHLQTNAWNRSQIAQKEY